MSKRKKSKKRSRRAEQLELAPEEGASSPATEVEDLEPEAPTNGDRPAISRKAIEKITKDLIKEFGAEIVRPLIGDGAYLGVDSYIPFNLPALEEAVNIPGLPIGRVTEVYGPEGVGKTGFIYHSIAQLQQVGGITVLIDNEHSFDPTRAQDYGVRLEDLIYTAPTLIEESCQIAESVCRRMKGRQEPVGVFWDSIGGGLTKEELEAEPGARLFGPAARVLTPAMKKLSVLIDESNVALVAVNQVRVNFDAGSWGPKFKTPGGQNLKHTFSLRLQFARRETISKGKHALGMVIRVRVEKNRFGPPFRTAKLNLFFDARGFQSVGVSDD